MELLKKPIAYFISFTTSILILVYIFDLPKYITENQKIVDLYTRKNFIKTFFSEMVTIGIYIGLTEFIIHLFKIKENYKKLLIVSGVTAVLSTLFVAYHKYSDLGKMSFFRKWFEASGWTYILYEVILVGTIYHVYDHMIEKISEFEKD